MKQLILLFLFISSVGFAQDFQRIDNIVKSYPKYTKPEQLAKKISKDFKDDASRVRAAFRWLTYNIRYDLEEYFEPRKVIEFRYSTEEERIEKLQAIKDNIVKEAFLTKMGVCEEYAQSFKKLADLMNIEAIVVKGYVRNSAYDIGRIPQSTNHAWNAVKIENKWILLDATWAAGYLYNGKWVKGFNEYFYAIDLKKVNRTHYPDHKRWQIVLNSGSLEDFYNQPIYANGLLRNNVDVVSPTKGNISVNRTRKIVLKFKNLSTSHRIFYNYRGQRYAKRPDIAFEGDVATVSLENPGSNTELYVFIDKNLALEYKVFVQ
jgi:hypothetical protein